MYLGTRKLWRDEKLFYEVTHTPWGVLQAKYLLVFKTWNLFISNRSVLFRLFCLLSVNCLPLTIKVIHTIRLTDTSGNIKFGLEHMHTFISVSSYRDLYSGTKPFSLHLGLFRFVDKSGSIFYDLIFLFLNFIFHITSMALTVDAHSLYRCLVLSTTATCSMWMSVVHYGSVIRVALI